MLLKVKSGQQEGQRPAAEETAPFTWNDSAGSLLKVSIRMLQLSGGWPLAESGPSYAYTAAVVLASLANVAEAVLGFALGPGGMDEVTLVLPNTLTTACGLVKLGFFLRDRHRYYALVRRVDRLAGTIPQEAPAVARRVSAFALFVVALITAQAVLWFPMPLIAYPGQRKLPFGQLPWSNYTQVPVFELSYVLQCFSSFTIANITLGFDCFFLGIMELAAAQLDLLAQRLAGLRPDGGHKAGEGAGAAYEELRLCVKSHQHIIRFTRHLEEMMSPIAMTQFMFSVLSVCILLFQATFSDDFSAVFRCVAFLPLPGGQMYLYCWAAHRITEKAEALSSAAYGCRWVGSSRRFQRDLAILMFRAQRPLVITAGHLYPVNRTTFVSLVNASYSYYALLGQINKR